VADALSDITKTISEHQAIRQNVKLAGETVNDIEAMFTLQKAYSGWTQSSTQELVEKQNQLRQAIGFLEQGLKNHFAFEEDKLPPLLGKLLMNALIVEHRHIGKQMEDIKTILADTSLEGLSHAELLAKKTAIREAVNDICHTVEEHADHEEIILKMIKKGIE
jgi:hypothetical protein